ncbi:MAG: hypothetical protein ABL916_21220 [Burkholderiaceae bacterium]
MSVHVHGTRIDDEFAALEMSGGSYPEHGESTHLIWINSRELQPGQQIEVRFQESGDTSPQGKTIAELFPEETGEDEPADFKPTEAMFAELRAKPSRRDGFTFELLGSKGTAFAGGTAGTDHGFGFSLVWNSQRPNRASHSLHAYNLDELESRAPMRDFVREYIEAPYSATLRLDA